jgi:glucose-6-phosphate isomerase
LNRELWQRYRRSLCVCESIGFTLDVSRMKFGDDFVRSMEGPMAKALDAMEALEKGAIANPDEQRRVGHYWLRAPELAPDPATREAIQRTIKDVRAFAADVHQGVVKPENAARFRRLVTIGIGGSALGPEWISDALGGPQDPLQPLFLDNTDPDGIDRVLAHLGGSVSECLTVVISKSGGTKETRNGMLELEAAYRAAGLSFPSHAVAVTGEGSELDQRAERAGWLRRFPMWDWVGGRTSEMSAVGLVPAALQGFDVAALLEGARDSDVATRVREVAKNPAAMLALSWYHATQGRGAKDMVVLPYKDRLLLFSRYLQQLVMESLGKEKDLDGKVVHQGIAVYGNKGSTDQHAYVQQLREGVLNFFVTFIEVLKDRDRPGMEVEEGATSGDYLLGFLLGTRDALYEKDRESVTLTIPDVSAHSLGALIALYERAVGLYASLVHINAYHQPGVEAGKKAAGAVIALQHRVRAALRAAGGPVTADALAEKLGAADQAEAVFKILEHWAANPGRQVRRERGTTYLDSRFTSNP